jgi:hypothetical protein
MERARFPDRNIVKDRPAIIESPGNQLLAYRTDGWSSIGILLQERGIS